MPMSSTTSMPAAPAGRAAANSRTSIMRAMTVKAVFLDFATVSNGDLDMSALKRVLPDVVLHDVTPDADIPKRMAGAQIVMTNKLYITRALIEANPQLRFVGVSATGTNNIALEAAREHTVAVCNVRDYCSRSVMQHVLAVILAHTHRLREFSRLAVDGSWTRTPQFTMLNYNIRELSGRVLGIVGYGTLGRAVAQGAQAALDMRVMIAGRPGQAAAPGRVDLEVLLQEADVLSLHCPLTPQTANMIGT